MFSTTSLIIVALYLVYLSTTVNTHGSTTASIVWKFIPTCLAFVIVLIAFKVI